MGINTFPMGIRSIQTRTSSWDLLYTIPLYVAPSPGLGPQAVAARIAVPTIVPLIKFFFFEEKYFRLSMRLNIYYKSPGVKFSLKLRFFFSYLLQLHLLQCTPSSLF